MSTVRDDEGKIINVVPTAVVNGKYSDERALNVDWFDLHPEDRSTDTEVAFVEATVSAEQAVSATGKDETLSGLRETFVAEVLAAKGDTSELRAAREKFLDVLEANKIIEVIPEETKTEFHTSEVPATLPPNSGSTLVVVPEVPPTAPTEIKENQNVNSNPSDKNVDSNDSSEPSSTNV